MLLFIFLDGIGIGPAEPRNPFQSVSLPTVELLSGGKLVAGMRVDKSLHLARTIDASLGVEGLPQSATGQTSLFTGINGPRLAGMHVSAFPTQDLRDAIAEFSFLKQAHEAGYKVTFANAFSPHYWQSRTAQRNRHSATTLTALAAGIPLRDFDDLLSGHAVYWDISHEIARSSYAPELPYVQPMTAGKRLASLLHRHDLVLYETFLTDLVGHRRLPWDVEDALTRVDAFLAGVLSELPREASILITSDHGNIEDPDTKGHTFNPVPLIVLGPAAADFRNVDDLTGVTPAILRYLARSRTPR